MMSLIVPPQDIGIIEGLTEYPVENLRNPYSHSIIRLKTITIDMTGEYVCTISTFQNEASTSTKMIVYGKFSKEFSLKFISRFIVIDGCPLFLSARKQHDGAYVSLQSDSHKFNMCGDGCATATIFEALHRRNRKKRSRKRLRIFDIFNRFVRG